MSKIIRVNFWVRYRKGRKDWVIKNGRYELDSRLYKSNAVSTARWLAADHYKTTDVAVELHILGKDGKIQKKDSYPRRLDPRKSKG